MRLLVRQTLLSFRGSFFVHGLLTWFVHVSVFEHFRLLKTCVDDWVSQAAELVAKLMIDDMEAI